MIVLAEAAQRFNRTGRNVPRHHAINATAAGVALGRVDAGWHRAEARAGWPSEQLGRFRSGLSTPPAARASGLTAWPGGLAWPDPVDAVEYRGLLSTRHRQRPSFPAQWWDIPSPRPDDGPHGCGDELWRLCRGPVRRPEAAERRALAAEPVRGVDRDGRGVCCRAAGGVLDPGLPTPSCPCTRSRDRRRRYEAPPPARSIGYRVPPQ